MIAQLGMYDFPLTRSANDRFWAQIRHHLGYGPDRLDHDTPLTDGWLHPDLILSQTCGYPYRANLAGKVQLVGTPDYGLEGCPPGFYRSIFVARKEDPRDRISEFDKATFAYNEAMSQSGWAAPRHHVDGLGITFGELIETGGHEMSARAVASGKAELASLDSMTWRLLQLGNSWTTALKVVGATKPTPGLPYISGPTQNRDAILAAVKAAIKDLAAEDRAVLGLRGIVQFADSDYKSIPTPPPPDKT